MSWLRQIGNRVQRPFRRKQEPLVYVAIGDSTVEGIGASHTERSYAHLIYLDLARHYSPVTYHNFGKSGARIHDVVVNQLDKTIAAQPQLVTLSIGANDVLRATSLKAFRADLEQLLQTLRRDTEATLIMTNVPDFSFTRRVPAAAKPAVRLRIKQYNRIIRQATETAEATLVDTFQESAIIARRFPEAVSSDNFHPSDLGYTLWANTMLTIIHDKLRPQKHSWLGRF